MKTILANIYDSDVFITILDDEVDINYEYHYNVPEELVNEYKKIKADFDLIQDKLYNFTKNNERFEPKSWGEQE